MTCGHDDSTINIVLVIIYYYYMHLRFNSHFPDGSGLAGTRMSPFWILLELRTMEVAVTTGGVRRAELQLNKSSPPTNRHPASYRLDTLPVVQPTVSDTLWKCVPVAVSVNEYLRLTSSISPTDRAQAQRIKVAFERRNQKSTAVVAQLQRKLESYKQRVREVESSSSRRASSGSGTVTVGAGSPWPAFDLLKGIKSVLTVYIVC